MILFELEVFWLLQRAYPLEPNDLRGLELEL